MSWNVRNSDRWALGYRFSIDQASTVDGLGFWDFNNQYNNTTVGLWQTDGTLITTVNTATSAVNTFATANNLGTWNFMDANVALAAGEYVVGSWGDGMEYAFKSAPAIVEQGLTFEATREQSGFTFQFPGQELSPASHGFFGGNVSFADFSVPEPTAMAIWSLIGVSAACVGTRRKTRAAA